MLRRNLLPIVAGIVLLLHPLCALAQTRGSRPWDERVLCPSCQSDQVVYILYGEPILDQDLKRALAARKVELGGCLVTRASKRWECRSCGHGWGNVGPETLSPP